jgi:hypothetical protein
VVARPETVALKGTKTSREQETLEDSASASRGYSEAGMKSEEGLTSRQYGSRPSPENHEVEEPHGGIAKPMRR